MDRRNFLQIGAGVALCGGVAALGRSGRMLGPIAPTPFDDSFAPPAHSVIPVVGDGKWIWREPPAGATGYLEPRPFQLDIGIHLEGRGNATHIKATTPAPISLPEQKLDEEKIEADGCDAQVRDINPLARQLCLAADGISAGQTISATAHYRLTIYKEYQKYEREQFPADQKTQKISNEVRDSFLGESPGIQTHIPQVRKLLAELTGDAKHPWDLARNFADWIPHNIKAQIGPYTGVAPALDHRLGDCEEMSAVFVALCRAAGIPARIVWVPNHNWSEFYLVDKEGNGHWIPVHTACYFWFGWTGVHELVLQKGDRLRLPERGNRMFRLQEDWLQWMGKRPAVQVHGRINAPAGEQGRRPRPWGPQEIGQWRMAARGEACAGSLRAAVVFAAVEIADESGANPTRKF